MRSALERSGFLVPRGRGGRYVPITPQGGGGGGGSLPTVVGAFDTSHAGTALDLTGYSQTLNETFGTFDIGNSGGSSFWTANQGPVFGAINNWQNVGDTPNAYPFSTNLQKILAQKSGGIWTGGLFQSVNASGAGFSQVRGYWEATVQVDSQLSTWNAVWMLSLDQITNPSVPHCEIDIMEQYGDGGGTDYFGTMHTYTPANVGFEDQNVAAQINTPGANLAAGMRKYGTLITTANVILYFDQIEVGRWGATQTSQNPMYMLLDLSLLETPANTNTRSMNISAVKVYSL